MLPRGVRNNNFGNIEDGPFARSLPGYKGSDGRFAIFETPQHGVAAMDRLLEGYGRKGFNTIDGIINRWAPASDGNPVSEYAKSVAQKSGFPIGQPIDMADPEVRRKVAQAMAEFETGTPMAQAFAADSKKNMNPMQYAMAQAPETVFAPAKAKVPEQVAPLSARFIANGPGVLFSDEQNAPFTQATHDLPTALARAGLHLRDDASALSALKSIDSDSGSFQFIQGKDGRLFRVNRKSGAVQAVEGRGTSKFDEAYDTAKAKDFAEMDTKIVQAAEASRGRLATLDRLSTLLSDPNVYQGKGGDLVLEAKKLAQGLGFKVEGVEGAEAARAIANQFALELRNPSGGAGMPGALSDKDREFLQQASAGVNNTPEGNRLIIEAQRRLAQRSLEVDALRQQYIAQNGRLDQGFTRALAQWSAQRSLFSDLKAAPSASSGTQALPKGVKSIQLIQ